MSLDGLIHPGHVMSNGLFQGNWTQVFFFLVFRKTFHYSSSVLLEILLKMLGGQAKHLKLLDTSYAML